MIPRALGPTFLAAGLCLAACGTSPPVHFRRVGRRRAREAARVHRERLVHPVRARLGDGPGLRDGAHAASGVRAAFDVHRDRAPHRRAAPGAHPGDGRERGDRGERGDPGERRAAQQAPEDRGRRRGRRRRGLRRRGRRGGPRRSSSRSRSTPSSPRARPYAARFKQQYTAKVTGTAKDSSGDRLHRAAQQALLPLRPAQQEPDRLRREHHQGLHRRRQPDVRDARGQDAVPRRARLHDGQRDRQLVRLRHQARQVRRHRAGGQAAGAQPELRDGDVPRRQHGAFGQDPGGHGGGRHPGRPGQQEPLRFPGGDAAGELPRGRVRLHPAAPAPTSRAPEPACRSTPSSLPGTRRGFSTTTRI